MKYRICFSVAGAFGIEMSFNAEKDLSYEEAAASINKEALAETLCIKTLGYTAEDITAITPEQYDAEFGGED